MKSGNALWLSFALGLVVLLIVGYCAAQFASRINSAGVVLCVGDAGGCAGVTAVHCDPRRGGVGKTALLEYLTERAAECRVISITGVHRR